MTHPFNLDLNMKNIGPNLEAMDYVVFEWRALFDDSFQPGGITYTTGLDTKKSNGSAYESRFRPVPGIGSVVALLSNANKNLKYAVICDMNSADLSKSEAGEEECDQALAALRQECKVPWCDQPILIFRDIRQGQKSKSSPATLLYVYNSLADSKKKWVENVETNQPLPMLFIGVDSDNCSAAIGAGCSYCHAASLYASLTNLKLWCRADVSYGKSRSIDQNYTAGKWWNRPRVLLAGRTPGSFVTSFPLSCSLYLYIHDCTDEHLLDKDAINSGMTKLDTQAPVVIDFGETAEQILSNVSRRIGVAPRSLQESNVARGKVSVSRRCKSCNFVHKGHVYNDGTWNCQNCKQETSAKFLELPLSMLTLYGFHPASKTWKFLVSSRAHNSKDGTMSSQARTDYAALNELVKSQSVANNYGQDLAKRVLDFAQWNRLQQIKICIVISQTSEEELKCVDLDMSDAHGRKRLRSQIYVSLQQDIYSSESKHLIPLLKMSTNLPKPHLNMKLEKTTSRESGAVDFALREDHAKREALYLMATQGIRARVRGKQSETIDHMRYVRVQCIFSQEKNGENDAIVWNDVAEGTKLRQHVPFADVVSITSSSIPKDASNPSPLHLLIIETISKEKFVFFILQQSKRDSFLNALNLVHSKREGFQADSSCQYSKEYAKQREISSNGDYITLKSLKIMASLVDGKKEQKQKEVEAKMAEDSLSAKLESESEFQLEKLILLQEKSTPGEIKQFALINEHFWQSSISSLIRDENREAARVKRRSEARIKWSLNNSGIFKLFREGGLSRGNLEELKNITLPYSHIFWPAIESALQATSAANSKDIESGLDQKQDHHAAKKMLSLVKLEVDVINFDKTIHEIQLQRLDSFLKFHELLAKSDSNHHVPEEGNLIWMQIETFSMKLLLNKMLRHQAIHGMDTLRGTGSHENTMENYVDDHAEILRLRIQFVIAALQKDIAIKSQALNINGAAFSEADAASDMKNVKKKYNNLASRHSWKNQFFDDRAEEEKIQQWKQDCLYKFPPQRCEHIEFVSSTKVGRQYLNGQRASWLISSFKRITSEKIIKTGNRKDSVPLFHSKIQDYVEEKKKRGSIAERNDMVKRYFQAISSERRSSVQLPDNGESKSFKQPDTGFWDIHTNNLETKNDHLGESQVDDTSNVPNALRVHSERRLVKKDGEVKEVHLDHNFVQTELSQFSDSVREARVVLSNGFIATKHGRSNKSVFFNLLATNGRPHERFFWLDQRTGSLCWENIGQAEFDREKVKSGNKKIKGSDGGKGGSSVADSNSAYDIEYDLCHSKQDQGKKIKIEIRKGESLICIIQTFDVVNQTHRLQFEDGSVKDYDLMDTSKFYRYTVEPKTKPQKGIKLKHILRVERGSKFHKPTKGWSAGIDSNQCLTLAGPFQDGYTFLELEFASADSCNDIYEKLQCLLFLRDIKCSPFRTLDFVTKSAKVMAGQVFIVVDKSRARFDKWDGPSKMNVVRGNELPSGHMAKQYFVRVEKGSITASIPQHRHKQDPQSHVAADWVLNRLSIPCILDGKDYNPDWALNKKLCQWLASSHKSLSQERGHLNFPENGGVILLELTNGSILDHESQQETCTLLLFLKDNIKEWYASIKSQIRAFSDNYKKSPVLNEFDVEIFPAHVHSGSATIVALKKRANGSTDAKSDGQELEVVCPPQASIISVRDGIIDVVEETYTVPGTTHIHGGEHTLEFQIDAMTSANLLLDNSTYVEWIDNKFVKEAMNGPDSGVIEVVNKRGQKLLIFASSEKSDWHEAIVSQVRATVMVDARSVSIGAENTYEQHSSDGTLEVSRQGNTKRVLTN